MPIKSFVEKILSHKSGISFEVITSLDDKSNGAVTVSLDFYKVYDWMVLDIPSRDLFLVLYTICINLFE